MTDRRIEGPRALRECELPALIRLLDGVFRTDGRTSLRDEHPYFYNASQREGLRVMLDGDRIASHFGVRFWTLDLLGVPLRLASVGGVCTAPEYRGLGLATRLLRNAESLCRRRGSDLIWVSGERGLYACNGYGPGGRGHRVELDAAVAGAAGGADGFGLRAARVRDLPRLVEIAEGEPVRFRRPPEELALLVAGRRSRPVPDPLWLVRHGGRDLAWLDLATFDERQTWRLWDYAGDRGAVCAGLALAMRRERADRLSVFVPSWDVALWARLHAAGARGQDGVIPSHSLKIPDFRRFIRRMRPALEARVGAHTLATLDFENRPGGGGAIRSGKHVLELNDPRDLVALVFGASRRRMPAACRRAPVPVDRFIAEALPLPLCLPGLNYV